MSSEDTGHHYGISLNGHKLMGSKAMVSAKHSEARMEPKCKVCATMKSTNETVSFDLELMMY